MSSADAVSAVREALRALEGAVARVQNEFGDTLGVRRLSTDVLRFKADLDELGEPKPGHHPGPNPDEMMVIDDNPYDESMWSDSDSEAQHAV
jgi:hypothetical protein